MEIVTLFTSGLFDAFGQPVLYVKDGAVTQCNAAAQALGICAGTSLDDCLDGAELPDTLPAALPLRLAGRDCTVTVRAAEDGLLLVAEPKDERLPPDALLSIAGALSGALTNLTGSAAALLPVIEELEDPRLQQVTAAFQRSCYQLLRLHGHLRDFGGALSGEMKLFREKTELCGFFQGLFAKTEPLCAATGVELRCSVPQRQFYGWIDRRKLTRAVLELLSNALKYTPKGGSIRMELLHEGKSLRFMLTDSGSGLDTAALAAAFTQFTHYAPLGDSRSGAGLGLPLVRHIVQLHGGRILLQPQQNGVVACISLPLTPPEDVPVQLRSPQRGFDESATRPPELVVLSDVLPPELYDSRNLD